VIQYGELRVDLGDGGTLAIPYAAVAGEAGPGPRLTVIAGVHGTEYASIAAARELLAWLRPELLSGTVTVAPVINLPAFWARTPFVVPLDGENLNRCFPGDPGGSASRRIAAAVTEGLIKGSDYLLDLHAGDLPESLEPFALYDESPAERQARDLALAYGLGHLVRQPARQRTVAGSTSAAAADLGIPAITAEAGERGIWDAVAVATHLRGLRSVLRHLGMLPGEPPRHGERHGEAARPASPAEHEGWIWMRSDSAGWWQPAVRPGTGVAAGDLLGTLSPLLGGAPDQVTAPAAGVPLFITSSPAVSAGGLLLGLALGTGAG
jgi:predicted deacylase